MPTKPIIFERQALNRNRKRAHANFVPFLHEIAAGEIKDRLAMVKKSFTAPAIVTGHGDFWEAAFPDAELVDDDDTLALAPRAHDLVIHAMALHWAEDPVGQMIQCRNALRPDGLFLAVAFGGQTLHELRAVLAQAETELTGGLSPRVAPMGEIREMGALLQRAGFALPVADAVSLPVRYSSPYRLMHELRAMGEGNALRGRVRHFTRPALLSTAARHYETHFCDGEGGVHATFELIFLLGWAPDPSQPKPLRPGSAKTRLAAALGVTETALKD